MRSLNRGVFPTPVCSFVLTGGLMLAATGLAYTNDPTGACDRATAPEVTVQDLANDPQTHRGMCVRVKGIWHSRTLYADMGAYYLANRSYPPVAESDGQAFPHVGLYRKEAHGKQEWHYRKFAKADIVGRAGVCSDLWRGKDGRIVMAAGHCHYFQGAFVGEAVVHYTVFRPVRFTGARNREKFGTLSFAPDDWQYRDVVEKISDQWLRAIRMGDRRAFRLLHGERSHSKDAAPTIFPSDETLDRIFADPNSPFRDMRPEKEFHRAMFVPRNEPAEYSNYRVNYQATVCFCRGINCSQRWPINDADARNATTRPFVCFRVEDAVRDDILERTVHTEFDDRDFREPDWPSQE